MPFVPGRSDHAFEDARDTLRYGYTLHDDDPGSNVFERPSKTLARLAGYSVARPTLARGLHSERGTGAVQPPDAVAAGRLSSAPVCGGVPSSTSSARRSPGAA